jgi:hypothetical protein
MTGQPSRVTPAEISQLLDEARQLSRTAPPAEQLAYHERKAQLLSLIAADLDTAEAHLAAAAAWHYAGELARQTFEPTGQEGGNTSCARP